MVRTKQHHAILVFLRGGELSLTLVQNLLDRDYAPIAGYPAPGRTGHLGVRFSF